MIKKISCPDCKKKFTTERVLKQHQITKHNPQIRKLPCPDCKRKFKTKSALKQLQIAKHGSENLRFRFLDCKRKSKAENELKQHQRAKERSMSQRIVSAEPLIVREEDKIDEVRSFKCKYCGREKAYYNQSHSPLYSKKPHLLINYSNCGKSYRDY